MLVSQSNFTHLLHFYSNGICFLICVCAFIHPSGGGGARRGARCEGTAVWGAQAVRCREGCGDSGWGPARHLDHRGASTADWQRQVANQSLRYAFSFSISPFHAVIKEALTDTREFVCTPSPSALKQTSLQYSNKKSLRKVCYSAGFTSGFSICHCQWCNQDNSLMF